MYHECTLLAVRGLIANWDGGFNAHWDGMGNKGIPVVSCETISCEIPLVSENVNYSCYLQEETRDC